MEIVLTEKEREEIRIDFGKCLRAKRQELGISQEELAFRSGLHRTYVGSVERGERNLSLENIYVFAKTLQCHPRDLVPNFPIRKKKVIRTSHQKIAPPKNEKSIQTDSRRKLHSCKSMLGRPYRPRLAVCKQIMRKS